MPKQEEVKEVSLLDMRRSNNIGMILLIHSYLSTLITSYTLGIVLSRLKITPEGIKGDLMRMDEKLLSREKVVALLKCVPTPEEVNILCLVCSYKSSHLVFRKHL